MSNRKCYYFQKIPAYYSIVVITIPGYGDISPSWDYAKFFVAFEVIIGYVALGGLISILGNKVARRS